jgi:hypothetical protein
VAPGVGAFVASGGYVSNENGSQSPVIVVSGTADDARATSVVIEQRQDGTTPWSRVTVAIPESGSIRTSLTGVAPTTLHNVRVAYITPAGLSAYRNLDNVTTGAMISEDTVLVGGRPRELVLDQIDTGALANQYNAEAILERALDDWASDIVFDALTHLEGEPIGTVVVRETSERINGDEAIVQTLALLGAKSGDALAWILNLDTVKVGPTESLGERLEQINVTFADNAASITELETAIATNDSAIAQRLFLLGAETEAGDAWLLNLDTVKVGPTESMASRLSTISASIGDNTAAIESVSEVVADIEGNLVATWGVTLDVNGRVSGIKLQEVGGGGTAVSTLDFLADYIRFYNGTTDQPVFEIRGGNLYLSGDLVQSDSLETGSTVRITADQSIGSSVTIPSRSGSPGYALIKTMDFEVDRTDSKFTVIVSFAYESTNSNVSFVWMKIGQDAPIWGGGGSADMTNADAAWKVSAYNGPATSIYTISGLPLGTNTLEIYAGSTGSGSHVNTANDCYFSVTEDKRPS